MRILTKTDLENILYGCSILGTGGGGTMEEGMQMINEALAAGKQFRLASFDEVDENTYIGTPYGCGAISPLTEEEIKKYARLTVSDKSPYLIAFETLEKILGRNMEAVISTELGGMNTATAFYTGAMTDRLIMDGDPAGRSVPGLQHSTYFLDGIPMCPMAVTNKFGESAVFTHVADDVRGETLVRALAVESQNMISVVDHVNTAGVLKKSVITGAISNAERIGKAYREAVEAGADCAAAVVKAGNGKSMFKGVIARNEYETRDGYTFGDLVIQGTDEWEGRQLKIWYQNENIISWLDGDFYVTVPDLIVVMNMDARFPQLNPYGKAGARVSVFCLPAPAAWTTKRGLDVFGPKSFGYDVAWTPFCGV
jgi:DUF917 family protein